MYKKNIFLLIVIFTNPFLHAIKIEEIKGIYKSKNFHLLTNTSFSIIAAGIAAGTLGAITQLVKFPIAGKEATQLVFPFIAGPLGIWQYEQFKNSTTAPLIERFSTSDFKKDPNFFEVDPDLEPEEFQEINQFVEILTSSKDMPIKVPIPNRICLIGPPGSGKTLYAKWFACELSKKVGAAIPFFPIKLTQLMSYFADGGALRTQAVFDDIQKQLSPGQRAIVFVDEIDGISPQRGQPSQQHSDQRTTTLLTLLDGFVSNDNLIFMCSTNRPQDLDPAILSRLNHRLTIPLPNLKKREAILKKHFNYYLDNESLKTNFFANPINIEILNKIAQQTEGANGRDLQGIVKKIIDSYYAFFKKHPTSFQLDEDLALALTYQQLEENKDPDAVPNKLPPYGSLEWQWREYNKTLSYYMSIAQEINLPKVPFINLISPAHRKKLRQSIADIDPYISSRNASTSHQKGKRKRAPRKPHNNNISYLLSITKHWSQTERKALAQTVKEQVPLNPNPLLALPAAKEPEATIQQKIQEIESKHSAKQKALNDLHTFSLPREQKKYALWHFTLEHLGEHIQNLPQEAENLSAENIFLNLYLNNPNFENCINSFITHLDQQASSSSNSNPSVAPQNINAVKQAWIRRLETFNQEEKSKSKGAFSVIDTIKEKHQKQLLDCKQNIKKTTEELGTRPRWHNLYHLINPKKRALYQKLKKLQEEKKVLKASIASPDLHIFSQFYNQKASLLPGEIDQETLNISMIDYLMTLNQQHATKYNTLKKKQEKNIHRWLWSLPRKVNDPHYQLKKLQRMLNVEEEFLQDLIYSQASSLTASRSLNPIVVNPVNNNEEPLLLPIIPPPLPGNNASSSPLPSSDGQL